MNYSYHWHPLDQPAPYLASRSSSAYHSTCPSAQKSQCSFRRSASHTSASLNRIHHSSMMTLGTTYLACPLVPSLFSTTAHWSSLESCSIPEDHHSHYFYDWDHSSDSQWPHHDLGWWFHISPPASSKQTPNSVIPSAGSSCCHREILHFLPFSQLSPTFPLILWSSSTFPSSTINKKYTRSYSKASEDSFCFLISSSSCFLRSVISLYRSAIFPFFTFSSSSISIFFLFKVLYFSVCSLVNSLICF